MKGLGVLRRNYSPPNELYQKMLAKDVLILLSDDDGLFTQQRPRF